MHSLWPRRLACTAALEGFVVTSTVLSVLVALVGPASAANLTVAGDAAFIDNRPADDPLATGLFINLNVSVTDSVGGTAALSAGTATFASGNALYNTLFPPPHPMSFATGRGRFEASQDVTIAQFPDITGTFTFTVTDVNGTVTAISHNLDTPEAPLFPTNIQINNHSTTPTITFTDPNAPNPDSNILRGYSVSIFDAITLDGVNGGCAGGIVPGIELSPSCTITAGSLIVGHAYDFRVEIVDYDIADVQAFLANTTVADPKESRSVEWLFRFIPVASPVPEPSTLLLLGSGLSCLGGLVWRQRRHRR